MLHRVAAFELPELPGPDSGNPKKTVRRSARRCLENRGVSLTCAMMSAAMRSFLITAGTVFGLIVAAHIARIAAEPGMAKDPWFWLLTLIAAALSGWAWRLLWRSRASKGPGAAS